MFIQAGAGTRGTVYSSREYCAVLAGATTVGLAGCTGIFGGTHDVEYVVSNDGDTVQEVVVAVLASRDSRVRVTFDDGETTTRDADDLAVVFGDEWGRITNVEALGDVLDEREHRISPGETESGEFEDVDNEASVIGWASSEAGPPPMNGFGSMWCSVATDIVDLNVRIRADGAMEARASCTSR